MTVTQCLGRRHGRQRTDHQQVDIGQPTVTGDRTGGIQPGGGIQLGDQSQDALLFLLPFIRQTALQNAGGIADCFRRDRPDLGIELLSLGIGGQQGQDKGTDHYPDQGADRPGHRDFHRSIGMQDRGDHHHGGGNAAQQTDIAGDTAQHMGHASIQCHPERQQCQQEIGRRRDMYQCKTSRCPDHRTKHAVQRPLQHQSA